MPTINIPKAVRDDSTNLNFKYVYNTRRWKTIRFNYLSFNPICAECKANGKISFSTQVHHIQPLSSVESKEDKIRIGFDIENLMALCEECHKKKHKQRNDFIK